MKKATPKKRVIKKRAKAANSPSPSNRSKCAPCGHADCKDRCRVRYIGPTTHVRDHHILHAARGISHVWPAVIIAGLAIVLTGAIAYHAANAQNQQNEQELVQSSTEQILNKLDSLENRIDVMERDIEGLFRAQNNNEATPDSVFPPLN
ncbi:hypothetical protein GF391_01155 [Candidatus Uhrbacteria bacterium]|nr:hypothetical protein [Candidatus Uhrbacteria bacterium]